MASTGVLSSDDIDEIGQSAFYADDPLTAAAELVAAVDEDRVVPAEVGYALMLAAEITERQGDLAAALGLAERAVDVVQAEPGSRYGFARAFRAELLLRLGREDEAMAEFAALRVLMGRDMDAVSYVSEGLEAGGRAEIAEQWLTAALETLVERRDSWRPGDDQASVAYCLAQQRYRLRRDLDLPFDELDELAERLRDAVDGDDRDDDDDFVDDDEYDYDDEYRAVLFWPQAEFARVLTRWPTLAKAYGDSWDEHRARLQRMLQRWAESGLTELAVMFGAADELADYAVRAGGDPTDPDVRHGYTTQQELRERFWPPGRNEACWCGSGMKYKKCCRLRAQA